MRQWEEPNPSEYCTVQTNSEAEQRERERERERERGPGLPQQNVHADSRSIMCIHTFVATVALVYENGEQVEPSNELE